MTTIILSILFPLFISIEAESVSTNNKEPKIYGFVYDEEQQVFLSNLTISVERAFYLGNSTSTNSSGYYEMHLPSGQYILRIYDAQQFIIFRTDFNVTDENLRLDFVLDSHKIDQSKVKGTILNKITYTAFQDAEVRIFRRSITGDMVPYRDTISDKDGKFSINLPAGEYRMEIWSDEKKIHSEDFMLTYGEEKSVELVLQKPTRVFNLENAIRFIKNEWLDIVFMIVLIVIGLFLVSFMDRVFTSIENSITEKPRRFVDLSISRFIERVVKWNIIIILLIFIIYILAQILDIATLLWVPISRSIPSIYTIILLIIFLRISLMIWKKFIIYLRGGQKGDKPKRILSGRLISIIEIIGKYILSFSFILGIAITAFAALGMSDLILGGIRDGLASNASFIIFIITTIIITYVVVRFLSTFFEDMKVKQTRFRPEMIDIAGKGIKFFIYGIIGMILIFTLLSAAGLGEIGQTLVLVFSLVLGMVVSMAATGSIGNILSGIVIMSFKPFEEGDWVILADKHTGQIIETNIMFTKIRDLDNEIIEVPNNMVLSTGIINWTTAGKKGGFAVEIDVTIGYDIPARQVITLLKESCVGIPNLLEFPKPNVVMTEFYNHAIGYKLRAYIMSPQIRFKTKTEIMINMQKKFTEAGVEILSPEYFVRRADKIPTTQQVKGRLKKINKFETTTPTPVPVVKKV